MASEIEIICLDSSEESDDEKSDTVTANMKFPVDGAKRNDPGETATNFIGIKRNDPGQTATNFIGIQRNDPGQTATNFIGISIGKSIEANFSPSSSLVPNPPKSFRDEVICPEKSVHQVIPDNMASNSNIDTISSSSMGESDNDFASDCEKTIFPIESSSSLLTFPQPNSFRRSPLGLNSFLQSLLDLPPNCLQADARRMDGKRQGQGTNKSQSVKDLRAVFASQMLKDGGTSHCASSEVPGCSSIESDGHYNTEAVSPVTNFQLQNSKGTKIPLEDADNIVKNKKLKKTSAELKEMARPLPNEITTSTKDLKIKKLEEALEKCAKEIKRLDETEVDLDGDDDQSAYVISSRFKERYMQIRQKIADIKMIPNELGRKSDKPFHFRGSKYSIVNMKIEKFINKNEAFPDFKDICKVIRDANAQGKMFTKAQLYVEAEKLFRKVGNKLKSRRLSDDDDVMSSYLPQCSGSAGDDPADKDGQLQRKLKNNLKEGQRLIDKFLGDDQEKQEVEKHDFQASDGDESDSLDGHESDFADNNSDEEDEEICSETEVDSIGSGSDTEKSEKEGKWVVIDKADDKCFSSFFNDATIDELLESDGEENVIEVDDCKGSVSSRPEAMANIETTIKFGCNVKDTISWKEKVNSEVKTRTEVLPNASNVMSTAEDSNASGMFDKIHMEEHAEKGKSIFEENLTNEVIIIDD